MTPYSFADVSAVFGGPSGSFQLAYGSGAAAEGIEIDQVEDSNTVLSGPGGEGMHSQNLSSVSVVTVSLLKHSPVNAQLMAAYNAQKVNRSLYGRNSITVRSVYQGDLVTCSQVAFKKPPTLKFAGTAEMQAWTFDAIQTVYVLGTGVPDAN